MAYTIGVDFGSLSCRAVLVDTASGNELASATAAYAHAVMDSCLAATGEVLPANFALQDPADYIESLAAVLPQVIAKAGVDRREVVGIGVDFTCCSMLPVKEDGTPLSFDPAFAGNKHAYVKMWKHHAAQKYAERINEVARARGEKWLKMAGGNVSSEFMFPKIYQTLDEAPEVYRAAYAFVEAGDFINWQLTGKPSCSYRFAAYKCQFSYEEGYPSEEFFAAVDERLRFVVRDKLPFPVSPAGAEVGRVSVAAAEKFGLAEGTVVAAACPDAHVAASAMNVCHDGDAFAIFGTSACFFVLGDALYDVPGICGVARDGVTNGFYGYEAGLCCFGDHFAFAAENLVCPAYVEEARARGVSMLQLLSEKAAALPAGGSGLIALNWWNGNRSVLGDSDLSGTFVGMTLQTRPEDMLRALFEATAFGTRKIFETFGENGVFVRRLLAAGGIAGKNPFLMQLFADILNVEISVARTTEAPAHGAAVGAAVAAGAWRDFPSAMAHMGDKGDRIYTPSDRDRAVYDALYAEYCKLHDYFGKGENNVMKTLRLIAAESGD